MNGSFCARTSSYIMILLFGEGNKHKLSADIDVGVNHVEVQIRDFCRIIISIRRKQSATDICELTEEIV